MYDFKSFQVRLVRIQTGSEEDLSPDRFALPVSPYFQVLSQKLRWKIERTNLAAQEQTRHQVYCAPVLPRQKYQNKFNLSFSCCHIDL